MPDEPTEAAGVDGPQLLGKDASSFRADLYLGAERGRTRAPRGGGDDNDGTRKEFVCLYDYPVASPTLLVTLPLG